MDGITKPEELLQDIVFVYGAQAGVGGLGVQSANAAASLATNGNRINAFGPGRTQRWPLSIDSQAIDWHEAPATASPAKLRYSWRRWLHGRLQLERDVTLGRWAAGKVRQLRPMQCYVFTQVGLEVLEWARSEGIPTVLESPNGHIRNFRDVNETESQRWCGRGFRGHPCPAMVERVQHEYEKADRIRVSSEWSKTSLQDYGVAPAKIQVLQQPVDLHRFRPLATRVSPSGPLRICFVGSLDLRKGFVYLLRAIRLIGARHVSLQIVGATGSRCCARLFEAERQGLNVDCAPGDPLAAYHHAELFVLPTLEDGSPFAVAEAMACGLPVVVTENCGSAEWVTQGLNGWVVPARQTEAIAMAIENAILRRQELRTMGRHARLETERRAGADCFESLRKWFLKA
jgi:glycosyltransferase involved in cell wall biosynthesis